MIDTLIQSADSLKILPDSAKSISDTSNVFSTISFDISKIGSNGIMLSVLGYVVVFLALLFLFLFFANLTKLIRINIWKKLIQLGKSEKLSKEDVDISGEINAAIAAALILHFQESHDFENTVITIKKVQRTYSPWSSKIYGLRENPRK